MKLFEKLKEIGVKVTGSYADGTQYESAYAIKGKGPKKGMSDIDFLVPEGKLEEIKALLTEYGIEWKDESEYGLITVDTFPAFDFSTRFYPRENKLPEVSIWGTSFKTH